MSALSSVKDFNSLKKHLENEWTHLQKEYKQNYLKRNVKMVFGHPFKVSTHSGEYKLSDTTPQVVIKVDMQAQYYIYTNKDTNRNNMWVARLCVNPTNEKLESSLITFFQSLRFDHVLFNGTHYSKQEEGSKFKPEIYKEQSSSLMG